MKKVFVHIMLLLIGTGMVFVFWKQELVYSLPTPVPQNYKEVKRGEELTLFAKANTAAKPFFLHFFNPACPCSRFNIKQFKSLVLKYGHKVDFMIIVQTDDPALSPEKVKAKFDLDLPVIIDSDKKIAGSCGVYSTPQAVIIDSGKLYYRGNYNKARYCTDKKSDYARMALDSLLNQHQYPVFSSLATKPYGCSLPGCGTTNSN